VRRYARIYAGFVRTSLNRELEFRANFFAKVGENVVWMVFFLLILQVVYMNADSIAGWSKGDGYILAATCFLLLAIVNAIFAHGLVELPDKVRKGTLDFDLVKPIDIQFLLTLRKFNFSEIGTLTVGLVVVFVGAGMSGHAPSFSNVAAYLGMLLCSITIFYSFNLVMMTTSIWLVRVDNLWVLGHTVFDIARFPLDIFGTRLRSLLTYYIPLAFIATMPAKALLGTLDLITAAVGVIWAVCFFLFARSFLRFALGHYTSASS
jgi:ABC-2 type transport system permease protein